MCGISAQFLSTHLFVRLHGTIPAIFFQPRAMCRISAQFLSTLNPFAFTGKRIDYFRVGARTELHQWARFSVRVYDRAWDAYFAHVLSTAERRLTRAIFWNVIQIFLFAFLRASINSFAFRKIMWSRFFGSRPRARASVLLIRSPSRNQCDPDFSVRIFSCEHQFVRLQEKNVIKIFLLEHRCY